GDEVIVVEPRNVLGRGVAYSTTDPHHLLNVRAKQMSGVVGDADHFLRWAGCDRDDFVPRRDYGRYLADLLDSRRASSAAQFHHVVESIERIERVDGSWSLVTARGTRLVADVVVIATGNPAPSIPTWASGAIGAPGFVADPWAPGALQELSGIVVAIGTGLTFVDVAVSVLESSPTSRVVGVSRHGLLPTPHTHVEHPPPLPNLHTPRDALHWLRSQRSQWREAVNGLRSITQALWIGWSDDERAAIADILAKFDALIESSKVGVRKPEPRFYEIACETVGVSPMECVFLDDLGINLKPAAAMGMTTIKVTGARQALDELGQILNVTFD
ncbi:MAG: HAD-IA family hydrolase, partial [Actinomycetota bacterium]